MPFVEAKRENVWLRMFLMAPTGGGKTLGALKVATSLFGGSLPVVGLDSERGRMKLYADQFRFMHDALDGDFSPEAYIAKMREAEREFPGGVLIVDSASHEWMGTKGILQDADKFGDWKKVRPRHNAFVDALLGLQMHVIVTCRSKMKYEVSEQEVNGRTRQVIEKLGLGPIQSDDIIYEFDVVGIIDASSHEATFSNRCTPLVDTTRPLDADVGAILTEWLSEGEPPAPPEEASPEAVAELVALLNTEGIAADKIEAGFAAARAQNRGVLHPDWVTEKVKAANERAAAKLPDPEPAPEPAAEPAAV